MIRGGAIRAAVGGSLAVAAALLAGALLGGCGGSSAYDPVTVTEIEHGRVPPGLAKLAAHDVLIDDLRCYPEASPTRCFYRAVAGADEAPGSEKGTVGFNGERQFVIVQFKPGAEKAADFLHRPAMEGRFLRGEMQSYEVQQALAGLRVDTRRARLFVPDTGEAGLFGSWLPIPLLLGLAGGVALLVFYLVRAGRGERPFASTIGAPASSVPFSSAPPAPPPTAPEPETQPRLAKGTPVVVLRGNGERVEATVVDARPGAYLCEVAPDRRAWVAADRVTPRA
jgi:hypothetical protein